MATSRTQQSHSKRVEQIAAEAAAKIAAESPLAEDVIVTIEEVPPTATHQTREVAASAEPVLGSQFAPTRYFERLTALAAANAACVQGIVGAQLKFAGRLAGAVSPRTR